MATSITSLYPSKNQTNVPVDANVELTIKSDLLELDIATIRFCINDIEIKPSSRYSLEALTGQDKTEVLVAFYPRRRIKFGNERYGANDTRYGKLDINVSNFIYGSRYVCKVYIEDSEGNPFEDHFAFNTEEGVFINEAPDDYYYSTVSQEMANYLPEWSRARYDKFSVFQQIANPIALIAEEVDKKIQNDFLNSFVQTANYNELANLYRVDLGANYSFKTKLLDDGTNLLVPPDVSAVYNISKVYPNAEFDNDIRSVYYKKIPDRIESQKDKYTSEVVAETSITLNRLELDYKMAREGVLCITTKNGLFFTINSPTVQNELLPLVCRIKGLSSQDAEQTEDVTIVDNDSYTTIKRWSYIESIEFINLNQDNPENFNFSISLFLPNDAIKPDIYRHHPLYGDFQPVSWKIQQTTYGTLLSELIYTADDIDDVIASLGARTEVNEYELLDVDGITPIAGIGMCVDFFIDWLYVIDANNLYIYDKREPYPQILHKVKPSPNEPQLTLVMQTDNLGRNVDPKTVEFSALQSVVDKTIVKYFYSVQRPNDEIVYLSQDGGIFTTAKEAMTIVESNRDPINTSTVSYEMDMLGDYVVGLHTQYSDGSISTDFKIARLMGKAALAKYRLDRILLNEDATDVVFDYDGKLKITDATGYIHTVQFIRDNMLVDYEKGTLYFNEDYREVRVDE